MPTWGTMRKEPKTMWNWPGSCWPGIRGSSAPCGRVRRMESGEPSPPVMGVSGWARISPMLGLGIPGAEAAGMRGGGAPRLPWAAMDASEDMPGAAGEAACGMSGVPSDADGTGYPQEPCMGGAGACQRCAEAAAADGGADDGGGWEAKDASLPGAPGKKAAAEYDMSGSRRPDGVAVKGERGEWLADAREWARARRTVVPRGGARARLESAARADAGQRSG